LLILIVFKV